MEKYAGLWTEVLQHLESGNEEEAYSDMFYSLRDLVQDADDFDVLYEQIWAFCNGLNLLENLDGAQNCYAQLLGILQEFIGEQNLIFFNVLVNSVEPLIQLQAWGHAEERMEVVFNHLQLLAGTEEEIIEPDLHGKLAEIMAAQEDWPYVIHLRKRIIEVLEEEEEIDVFKLGWQWYHLGLAYQMDGNMGDSVQPFNQSIQLWKPHRYEPEVMELYGAALCLLAAAREDEPELCKSLCEEALAFLEQLEHGPPPLYGITKAQLGKALVQLAEFQLARQALEEGLFWQAFDGADGVSDFFETRNQLEDILANESPTLTILEALQLRWPEPSLVHAWEAHTQAWLFHEEGHLQEAHQWAKTGLSLYQQMKPIPWEEYEDLFFHTYYELCQQLELEEEAFEAYETLYSLAEVHFGEASKELIPYLIDLGAQAIILYGGKRAYPFYHRLLPIVEREEDQSYFLGICYIMQGAEQCENKDYESAFRCLEKARYLEPGLEGTEEELTHYRFFLHNGLGLCYWMFDKNNLAIEAYEIAIASGEKRAIKDFAYFQCHALAGIIQFGDNNLEKAEQYLEVCMQEDSFWWDQNHSLEKLVKYAWAMLMSLKDNNSEAEFYFDQYLDELPAELEEARGLLLSRQAMVYSDSGRYERAIEMQLAAIAYFEEHQPEAVEFRLVALRDLTTSYAFTRQKKEAILSNKKAIHLARATYGESDLRVLDLEVNLVGIYNIFFDHYGGIRIIEKGMKFFDQNPEHKKSHVYVLLVGAAVSTYSSLGDEENTQKYSQLFSQAREKNPYIDDIIQSEGLVDMSLKHISKDKKGAIETMNTSMGSILSELEANFGYLTEAEKVIFLQKYRLKLYLFFVYLAEAMGKGETKDASHALILWLRLKGLVLYSHSNLMRQVYEQANEQSAPTLDQWKSLRARKIALFESEESFDAQQSEDISQKISQLEKALNFRQKDREDIPEVDLKALRDHLHPNEAALEFVSLSPPMGLGEEIPFQIYVVFILLPDQENILLHMIEKGNEIEEIIGKLGRTHTQEAHQALAEELWTYLWQPIASILEPYSTIYLCVDGMLSLCNFNLFRNPDSKALLMDEKELIYLTSIRSLESVKAPRPAFPGMNLILGAPDYGPPGWANWSPLPGAKEETQQIAFLLDDHQISLQIFQGQEAKKEKLWEHTSPGILHLATHAYFSPPEFQAYPEPDFEEYVEFNQFRGMGVPPPSNLGEHEEAMFHAGIVLAGANASNKGILTAFEVSQLDLSETQLVVLSGCETGLGKVTEGEGVFGLQRAFFAAGAKAIIMSLWSVPDEPTQHLFQLFYEYWLQDQDKQLAFRKAQQAVRGRFPNPRDWGGFILLEN